VYRTRDEEFSLIRSEKVDLKISTKKIEDVILFFFFFTLMFLKNFSNK